MTDAPREGKDLVHIIADEAVAFSAPVIAAGTNPWARARLLDALGWDLTALTGASEDELTAWFGGVEAALAALAAAVADQGEWGFDKVKRIAEEGSKASAVASLPPLLRGTLPPGLSAEDMGVDLLSYLTVNRLHAASPVAYRTAVLLGLVTPAADGSPSVPQPDADNTPPVRLPRRRDTIHLDRIIDLLTGPGDHLRAVYLPNGVATQGDADRLASMAFPRIAALLGELGVPARYGISDDIVSALTPAGVALSGHMLSIAGEIRLGGSVTLPLGATIALRYRPGSSGATGTLGLVVVPRLGLGLRHTVARWRYELELDADAPGAVEINENGFELHGSSPSLSIRARASRLPDASGFALLLGPADGTHLAIGSAALEAFAVMGTGREDLGVGIAAQRAEVVVRAGDGDAFLKRVLPTEGLRVEFDLGLAWSQRGGVVIAGGLSTAVTLPIHLGLGPFEIDSVHLALDADVTGRTLGATAALTLKMEIGALKAVVERIGITGELSFPQSGGGALGPVQLVPKFKAPDGVGMTIKAGPVTGGGYLFIDEVKGQYAGALELGFGDFKLAALGLLNTKLPDGSPILGRDGKETWSLIVVAAAQWKPVHIAFGIHIAGAGLVVGLHRTTDLPALRAGVRTKALDAVLFPPDPVGNAPQLLSTLGTLFPVAPDRHVFGLMAKFTWGPEAWLSLELALLLEIPAPLRLIVLGRVTLKLPEKKPVVELRLDSVGILDLDKKEFSLDATFVDSKIAGMELTGDMLVRAAWGDRSVFAFSAGGFHPRYTPPPGFPEVRRLTLAISKKKNPKITLTAYLAVTSNSLQLGARLEVHAEALGFSIDGHLVFDALIRWSPFGLDLYLEANVALKRGDRVLMKIELQLSLVGPQPWVFKGKASFSLWFINGSIPVEGRWGPPEPQRDAPAPLDPTGRTTEALSAPGAWSVRPPSASSVATLRAIEDTDGLLVHPLGQVGVQQAVLPLAVSVQRLGRVPLDRPRMYTIVGARIGGSTTIQPATPILAAFAPGEFFDLTDDQRLARPDFEMLQAGAWFGAPGYTVPTDAGTGVFTEVTYERGILDAPTEPVRSLAPESLAPERFARSIATGPAAVAPVRRSGAGRFATDTVEVAVLEPRYAVSGLMQTGDGSRGLGPVPDTFTAVLDHFGGPVRGEDRVRVSSLEEAVR